MKHPMQCYAFQRGDKYTITVYYEEGGYYQYERAAPARLKKQKDWDTFRSEIAAHGEKCFAMRTVKKSKTNIAPKRAKDEPRVKLSSKKPVLKYTTKNNPLLRRH